MAVAILIIYLNTVHCSKFNQLFIYTCWLVVLQTLWVWCGSNFVFLSSSRSVRPEPLFVRVLARQCKFCEKSIIFSAKQEEEGKELRIHRKLSHFKGFSSVWVWFASYDCNLILPTSNFLQIKISEGSLRRLCVTSSSSCAVRLAPLWRLDVNVGCQLSTSSL